MIQVRKAGLTDLTNLVAWGKDAHARSNYAEVAPYNSVVTRQFFKGQLKDPNSVFLVAMDAGKVRGLLIGLCDLYPFSHVRFATDMLFVADAGGDLLLDGFVAWARSRKVAVVESAPSQQERFEALTRMFESRGFARLGGTFRLVLGQSS